MAATRTNASKGRNPQKTSGGSRRKTQVEDKTIRDPEVHVEVPEVVLHVEIDEPATGQGANESGGGSSDDAESGTSRSRGSRSGRAKSGGSRSSASQARSKGSSGSKSGTRPKSSSRPAAKASSGSRKRGSTKAGSASKSKPSAPKSKSGASKSKSGARASSTGARSRQASSSRSERRRPQRSRSQRSMPTRAKEGASGALHDVGGAAQTATKTAGHTIGTAAEKAKGPALAAGAVAAAVGGGIALSRAGKLNLRRHKRVLGVPLPARTAFGKAAKQVSEAVETVGSAGKQIGEWSDGFQELRQKVSDGDGKSPIDKLTDKLPIDKLTSNESPLAGLTDRKSGPAKLLTRAQRVLS